MDLERDAFGSQERKESSRLSRRDDEIERLRARVAELEAVVIRAIADIQLINREAESLPQEGGPEATIVEMAESLEADLAKHAGEAASYFCISHDEELEPAADLEILSEADRNALAAMGDDLVDRLCAKNEEGGNGNE